MKFRNLRKADLVQGRHVHVHTHGWLEVVIYVRGHGGTIIGDRHYPVHENDFTVIPASIPHDQTNDTDLVSICIEYEDSGLERFTGLWHDTSGLIRRAGERLFAERDLADAAADDLRTAYAREIIGHIKRTVAGDTLTPDDGSVLQRSMSIVSDCNGMIAVRELAKCVSLTERQLRDLYRRRMRTSPMKHIINQRLEHARAMLCAKKGSVESIAEICGFTDVAYFTRIFKRYTNVTPARFRARTKSVR